MHILRCPASDSIRSVFSNDVALTFGNTITAVPALLKYM